jgi:hypothetical protein
MLTESEFNTFLYCSKLNHLGGSIHKFHASQNLIYESLKDLNLKILKNEISHINKDFIDIVKFNIKKCYPLLTSIDDIQHLINWSISLYESFYNIFRINKYAPLAINFEPLYNIENFSINFNTDIILFEDGPSPRLHVLLFYPEVDDHLKQNDFLASAKIQCFKDIYSNIHPAISIKLHYLAVPQISFRNKSQRNYSFKHASNGRIRKVDKTNFIYAIDYYNSYKNRIISAPHCIDYNCQKRKECKNG